MFASKISSFTVLTKASASSSSKGDGDKLSAMNYTNEIAVNLNKEIEALGKALTAEKEVSAGLKAELAEARKALEEQKNTKTKLGETIMAMGFVSDADFAKFLRYSVTDEDAPVIWRGPKKNAVVRSLVHDVCWGDLDVLVVDTPPGTSDEHLSVIEHLLNGPNGDKEGGRMPDGAILVTTPQNVAVLDVKKELTFCRKMKIPILGVVENMSGYVCPHCSECTNIFSSEGGKILAEQNSVPFLGAIPIDPNLCAAEETGVDPFTLPTAQTTLAPLIRFAESFTK